MTRIVFTQKELETKVEKALENACAFHATGQYKLMYKYWGEVDTYLEMLEDNGVWYDDITINDHVQAMIDILEEESRKLKISY